MKSKIKIQIKLKELGIEQKELAEKLGLNEQEMSRIIKTLADNKSIARAIKIAEILNSTVEYLFKDD